MNIAKITRQSGIMLLILLIINSTIFSYHDANIALGAEENHEDGTGGMINPNGPQEFEDSIISKNATYTGNPGEYFIDLNIEGKDQEVVEPTDIVLVYDNSNSMATNNRVGVAYDATSDFINQMLTNENENIRMALVSFGTHVMDGRSNQVRGGRMGNFSYKTLTNDPSSIIEKLPTNVPTNRGRGNNGGTYTQEALVEAQDILAGSDADNKVVITITDGVPTISHDGNRIQGNGTNFFYGNSNHGTNTINAAKGIQSSGIDMHSIGVEISGDAGATQAEAKYVMENIASTPTRYHNAEQVDEIVDILSQVATGFLATINNGTVTDPMGELVDLSLIGEDFVSASDDSLSDGDYYLSASKAALLDGVTVSLDGETITLDNLNLAAGESINLRYKVHLDTENENFEGNEYFETNGTTTLAPRADSDIVREFEVPSIKGPALEVSGTKIWEDIGGESNRPDEIEIDLYRSTDGGQEEFVETAAVAADENNEWGYIFEGYPMYSSRGLLYDYYVKEVTVDGYKTSYSDDGLDITNTLIAEPSINLVKTSNKEIISEVGEEVTYTFEVENTGNVVLDNIVLNDPMLGGGIELENTTLEPGGTTTVSVNHTVTQEDLNQSDVENVASVTGEDPSDNPIEDDDTVTIPTDQVPSINLVKTADRDNLVSGEAINYTFTATNTGNVTLTDVNISDVLEGLSDIQYQTIDGEPIEDVENITLQPGQVLVATADYTITQGDVDSGVVDNHATVAGTPPNTDEPVEAEDNVTVPQDIEGALTLEKTSDVDEIIEAGQSVVYTFLITNTSNVTMNDIVLDDPMLGGNIELPETELAPGASTTVDVEYQVTQADMDNGNIENIATVNGTDPRGNEHEDEDSDEIPSGQTPAISLVKEADRNDLVADEAINYTFTATNTGNVTLTDVNISDVLEGLSDIQYQTIDGEPIEDVENITLQPGQVLVATADYTITQGDVDSGVVDNHATVAGTPPNTDEPVEAEDNVTVPQDIEGALTLEKTSDVDEIIEAGQSVVYTFLITNTSNVTMNDIVLDDPMLGGNIELPETELAPGASTTVDVEYQVTQADMDNGNIENIATVNGTDPRGNEHEDEDNDEIPIKPTPETELESGISLEKIADAEEIVEVGQEVTYTFEITNTGETNLENITLTDEMLGGNIDVEQTALAPGESMQISAKYMVKEADLENDILKNVATVTGMNPEDPESDNPPTDEDEVETPVNSPTDVEENPGISLVKDSNVDNVTEIGEVITYTFTIENIGDVELGNVILNDPMLGGDLKLENTVLAPGEQMSVSQEHTVTEEQFEYATITNKALVTGDSPSGDRVESTDEVKVTTESKQPDEEKPDLVTAKSVNGKGSHTVSDNNEVFTYEIETIIDDSLDIDSFSITDSVDNRISIDSVDITIDRTAASGVSDEAESLMAQRSEIEKELQAAKGELAALNKAMENQEEEATEEASAEETVEEATEEPSAEETVEEATEEPSAEETVEEATEEPSAEETVEEATEEPSAEETVEEATEEPSAEETVEEATEEPSAEETVEEATEEPSAEETVEEATEEPSAEETVEEATEEASAEEILETEEDTKSEVVVNEETITELKVLIEELEAQITEIDQQLETLNDDLEIPAGSIVNYGDLEVDGQNINFTMTDAETIEALKGVNIKMTINAAFNNIDEKALAEGIDNIATVAFGNDSVESNTVTVRPNKPAEPEVPEPEEPTEEPQPEEPTEESTPEPQPEEPTEESTPEPQPEEPTEESTPEPQPEEPTEESTPEPQPEEPTEESTPEPQPEEPTEESTPEPQPEEPTEESTPEPQPEEPTEESTPEPQPEEPTEESTPELLPEESTDETKKEGTLPYTGEAYERQNIIIITLFILGLGIIALSFAARRRKQ